MGIQGRESPGECTWAEKVAEKCGQEEVSEAGKTIQGTLTETLTPSSHLPAWNMTYDCLWGWESSHNLSTRCLLSNW